MFLVIYYDPYPPHSSKRFSVYWAFFVSESNPSFLATCSDSLYQLYMIEIYFINFTLSNFMNISVISPNFEKWKPMFHKMEYGIGSVSIQYEQNWTKFGNGSINKSSPILPICNVRSGYKPITGLAPICHLNTIYLVFDLCLYHTNKHLLLYRNDLRLNYLRPLYTGYNDLSTIPTGLLNTQSKYYIIPSV